MFKKQKYTTKNKQVNMDVESTPLLQQYFIRAL